MRSLATAFLSPLITIMTSAQVPSTGSIYGIVTDSLTSHPLENTNVYLSSTTIGTSTDSLGRYTVRNLPPGKQRLVFSRVGYSVKVMPLSLASSSVIREDAQLQMHPIELSDIEVSSTQQEEWHKHLGEFKLAFLGDSWNAAQSTLLNPEVLDFQFDEREDILTASAKRSIIVENRGLGYRDVIEIAEFHWNVKNGSGRFLIFPYFQPLDSTSRGDSAKWEEYRRVTYLGSLQHFLRALYSGNVVEEGFGLYGGERDHLERGHGKYLFADQLKLQPESASRGKSWTFDGWIRVEYKGTTDRIASYLHLVDTEAIVESSGTLRDPLAVEILGHWSRARIADMLPTDIKIR